MKKQTKGDSQDENMDTQGSKKSVNIPSDPENKRTRKPGSQSNSSKQSNNGRGGGK